MIDKSFFEECLQTLHLTTVDRLQSGFLGKSLGSRVQGQSGKIYWLKISLHTTSTVPEANFFPKVYEHHTIKAKSVVLMEYLRTRPVSLFPWLTKLAISPTELETIAQALTVIKSLPAAAPGISEAKIHQTIQRLYPSIKKLSLGQLVTTHGDLTWTNVRKPFYIFDFDSAGVSFNGLDEAMLYICSLPEPTVAQQLTDHFHNTLNSEQGRYLQLYAIAELMLRYQKMKEFTSVRPILAERAQTLIQLMQD